MLPVFSSPRGFISNEDIEYFFMPEPMKPVRVKGGMSLRNGMWHGLRNDIIMRNLIYADRF